MPGNSLTWSGGKVIQFPSSLNPANQIRASSPIIQSDLLRRVLPSKEVADGTYDQARRGCVSPEDKVNP